MLADGYAGLVPNTAFSRWDLVSVRLGGTGYAEVPEAEMEEDRRWRSTPEEGVKFRCSEAVSHRP